MFVVIVGCSATGYHLSKFLLVEQHEVVIVERNLGRCQLLWEELGSVVMQGDGTDLVDLRRAGIARADIVVAVTGRDETNLVVCQLAKHAFSVGRTVATIRDPRNEPVFRLLGVDAVVDISDLILGSLERSVVGSSFNHLANLSAPNRSLVSLIIPEDSEAIGKKLSEVGPLGHNFITVVVRGNEAMPPNDDLVLQPNDEVYAITVSDEETDLYEKLAGV